MKIFYPNSTFDAQFTCYFSLCHLQSYQLRKVFLLSSCVFFLDVLIGTIILFPVIICTHLSFYLLNFKDWIIDRIDLHLCQSNSKFPFTCLLNVWALKLSCWRLFRAGSVISNKRQLYRNNKFKCSTGKLGKYNWNSSRQIISIKKYNEQEMLFLPF